MILKIIVTMKEYELRPISY